MAAEVEAWNCAAQGDGVFSVGTEVGEASENMYDDDLIDGEVNGNWTPQEKAIHEARLKAKAKRRLRKSSSSRDSTRESLSECVSGDVPDPLSPKGKTQTHDRKSRMGKGRGLPKK
ncbi:programmed cell death 4a isoform X1, partial [Silurus meridionalis]